MKRELGFLTLAAVLVSTGCSHVGYHQAHVDGETTEYGSAELPVQTYQLVLHEFHLYDRTGGFCAGMLEAGGKEAAKREEAREMVRRRRRLLHHTHPRGLRLGPQVPLRPRRHGMGRCGARPMARKLR